MVVEGCAMAMVACLFFALELPHRNAVLPVTSFNAFHDADTSP